MGLLAKTDSIYKRWPEAMPVKRARFLMYSFWDCKLWGLDFQSPACVPERRVTASEISRGYPQGGE